MKTTITTWGLAVVIGLAMNFPAQASDLSVTGKADITQGLKAGTSSGDANFEFRTDGIILSKGVYTGSGSLTTGDKTLGTDESLFLWYPAKAALIVGSPSSDTLTEGNIGTWSTNLGQNNIAYGYQSVAIGSACSAGDEGIAIGTGATATGGNVALGYATANANGAFAGGEAVADGDFSFAFGMGDGDAYAGGDNSVAFEGTATGNNAVAMGEFPSAIGDCSAAFNNVTTANGTSSAAFNYTTTAYGDNTASFGDTTIANAFDSFSIGRFNLGSYTSGSSGRTAWVTADPLFEVGNGADSSHKADAFVVYKNGNAAVQGTLQVAPGGDIPMYSGS